MRYARFSSGGGAARWGLLADQEVVELDEPEARDIVALLRQGPEDRERATGRALRRGPRRALADVQLEPAWQPLVVVAPGPRPDPTLTTEPERHREFYIKTPGAVVGPAATIPQPAVLGRLSYRAQLGLVFDGIGRHVAPEHILDHLVGVVVAAEVTSIGALQVGWEGSMWHIRYGEGAAFDGSCPLAGVFVTADEIDLDDIALEDAHGAARVRRADLAAFASRVGDWMELSPRVMVLAGSPHGPVLTKVGDDPMVEFPPDEPRIEPGGRIWVRSPLGAIDVTTTGAAANGVG